MTRRTSRTLIGLLCFTTIFGLAIYAIAHRAAHANTAKAKPSDSSVTLLAGAPAPVTTAAPAAPTAITPATQAATVEPSTAPASGVAVTTLPKLVTPAGTSTPSNPDVKTVAFVQSPTIDGNAVSEGKAKIASGDLIAGRKILNDALMGGQLSQNDAAAAKQAISDANKSIIFSTKRFSDDSLQETHTVAPGEMLQKIAFKNAVTSDFLLKINGIPDAKRLRAGANIKVIKGPFHLVVTKHLFNMDIYLGSPGEKDAQYVMSYPVGLGRDDSTPTGTWMVEQRVANPKYYSPRGEGVIAAGDPKNPLGPCWIALTGTDGDAVGKQSYGIHGTIEPNSIGKQSSMGCIRMHNEDALSVFNLVVSNQTIVIVKS